MIIKSLYEGILADMESTMSRGDSEAGLIALNQPDSDARKMFGIDEYIEEPFRLKDDILYVTKNESRTLVTTIVANTVQYNITPILKDIDTDTMLFYNGVILCGKDVFSGDILKPNIISSRISCTGIKDLKNVSLISDPVKAGRDYIPTIQFDKTLKLIENCKLDIFYQKSMCRFATIPTLKNVSSSSIKCLRINGEINNPKIEWRNTLFNKVFDFGYTLNYTTLKDSGTVKINNMSDIKKIVTSKDFYGRTYDDWPYKVKRNAKLSDMIDISKFDGLETVIINDSKMSVMFENTKVSNCQKTALTYFNEMLKPSNENSTLDDYRRVAILEHIPITLDGWNIFIIRL